MNDPYLLNRLVNSVNKYQGSAEKVLCICSAGLLRSPTLASLLIERGYNARAAGIVQDYALIYADQVLMTWADTIFCMDSSQFARIQTKLLEYELVKPLHNLNVPDIFGYRQIDLINLLNNRLLDVGEKYAPV